MNYDVESLMADIERLMVNSLNSKILAINVEKADSIVLDTIADDAYIFQSLDERVMNRDPFVFYGLANSVEANGIGPAVSKKLKIHIAVISFAQNKSNIGVRYLRYNRAVEEAFLSQWDSFSSGGVKLKVTSPILIDFTLLNSSDTFRVVGVELEANLG